MGVFSRHGPTLAFSFRLFERFNDVDVRLFEEERREGQNGRVVFPDNQDVLVQHDQGVPDSLPLGQLDSEQQLLLDL